MSDVQEPPTEQDPDVRMKEEWAEATRGHKVRLEKAAGISSVIVVCHDDTWRHVILQTNPLTFGDTVWGREKLGRQKLSGPDLVHVLIAMKNLGDRLFKEPSLLQRIFGITADVELREAKMVLSQRVYKAAAKVVDGIDLSATDGAAVPDIVIDARMKSA